METVVENKNAALMVARVAKACPAWRLGYQGIKSRRFKKNLFVRVPPQKITIRIFICQATPAEVPDYDDNSVAPVNPNAPIVEVIDKHKSF